MGFLLDRYEQPTDRTTAYAQIDIPDDRDQWGDAIYCVQSASESFRGLISEERIGSPCLDIALTFPSASFSTTLTIPAQLASAAGATGMDIKISVYLSSDDRGSENG